MASKQEMINEISRELTARVDAIFASFGQHQRLTDARMAAELYRNYFNAMQGAMCAKIGLEETVAIVGNIIKKENEQHRERRIVLADGWDSVQ